VVAQGDAEGVAGVAVLEHHGELVVRAAIRGGIVPREDQAVETGETLAVAPGQPPSPGDLLVEAGQLAEAERRPGLVHPEVEAHAGHVVALGVADVAIPGDRRHRVGPERADALVEVVVVGRHQPALADEQLRFAEQREAAERAHGAGPSA